MSPARPEVSPHGAVKSRGKSDLNLGDVGGEAVTATHDVLAERVGVRTEVRPIELLQVLHRGDAVEVGVTMTKARANAAALGMGETAAFSL
jgi:hypothetical protein